MAHMAGIKMLLEVVVEPLELVNVMVSSVAAELISTVSPSEL